MSNDTNRACPIFPNPPAVRRAHTADDLYRMAGWVDLRGHHEGDGVPRLTRFPGNGWQLWHLARRESDGEVVMTITEVPCRDCDEPTVVLGLLTAMRRYAEEATS